MQDLRKRIYLKAKAEPAWRFWGLYVHVCKMETLQEAYRMAKANNGAPGIDGVTFEAIEKEGLEQFLESICEELVTETYLPQRNRQKEIPKGRGKTRTIGIPTIRDRVVQGALKLILEPIFEADFQEGSYGYRPKRTPHQAVQRVAEAIVSCKTRVIDVDLAGYFDTVRHDILLRKVAERVNDDQVMHLLKLILKAGGKRGVPQGGVISPMLSNIYLNEVDKMLEKAKDVTREGRYTQLEYARFADDSAPRRRTGGRKSSVQPSCTRDEGGPFGVAVQAETSNHLLLLHLRDVVVSESGKGRARPCQIRTVESNANEPLMTCRKRRNDVKTGRESLTRDKSGSNLLTGQTASGIKAARTRLRLLCGTWEPVTPMLREKHKERSSKCQSTDAGYRGGVTCNSDEGSVMELERRGYPIQSETCEQPAMGGFA